MSQEVKKKRRKRGRGLFIVVLLVLPIAFLLFLLIDVYRRADTAFIEMYEPIGEEVPDLRSAEGLPSLELGEDPFSVLILGLDEGRSDSMMVATVNPNLNTTYLLSIPRDTMVDIPGRWTTRINHAFAYGGAGLAIQTVQNLLNIPIDYHVSIYMGQFHSLVDAFGGVRVYNDTVAFSMGGYDFPLGPVNLTGSAAYYYVRMRMDDPRGDFGRQERQRDVLVAMVNELAGVTALTRYQQILDSVGDHMRTNVTLNEMLTMSIGYHSALRNITHLTLTAPGSMINGMFLIPIPEHQRLEMSDRLRAHLELN
ncbi:MAG: LCP family protein [Defluviitaleaceae bacterium]|nr:LCP family protein [Defluviitaleaceae bacterium]